MKSIINFVLLIFVFIAFAALMGTSAHRLADCINKMAIEHQKAVEDNLKFIDEISGN